MERVFCLVTLNFTDYLENKVCTQLCHYSFSAKQMKAVNGAQCIKLP